jgi:hypothetical protein
MSEHLSDDAAAVFAIINDPQYNALRLHLMADDVKDSRLNLDGAEEQASLGKVKNARVVRRSE